VQANHPRTWSDTESSAATARDDGYRPQQWRDTNPKGRPGVDLGGGGMHRSAWNRGGAGWQQQSNFQRANDSKEMWARELPLLVEKNRQLGDSSAAARPFAPPSAPAPWHTQAIAAMTPQTQVRKAGVAFQ